MLRRFEDSLIVSLRLKRHSDGVEAGVVCPELLSLDLLSDFQHLSMVGSPVANIMFLSVRHHLKICRISFVKVIEEPLVLLS